MVPQKDLWRPFIFLSSSGIETERVNNFMTFFEALQNVWELLGLNSVAFLSFVWLAYVKLWANENETLYYLRVCSSDKNDTTSYFSVSLKFGACYITGQIGGGVQSKNTTSYFHLLFWHFLLFFIINFVFLSSFSFPFLMNYQISASKY